MNFVRPLLVATLILSAAAVTAAPTVELSASQAVIKGDPIVLRIKEGKPPFAVTEVGAKAKGGLLQIQRKTSALPGQKTVRYILTALKAGTATVSVSDAEGKVEYAITVVAKVTERPKPAKGTTLKASLSAKSAIVGGEPVTLTITEGKPPYKVVEASKGDLVRIVGEPRVVLPNKSPTKANDSFTIAGLRAGTASIAVSDSDGSVKISLGVVAPKADPVKQPDAPPLEASLSTTSIAVGGTPATVRIQGGLPPYQVSEASGSGNVRIALPGSTNPAAKERPLDGHAIHGQQAGNAVIAIRDKSGQLLKLKLSVTPARK